MNRKILNCTKGMNGHDYIRLKAKIHDSMQSSKKVTEDFLLNFVIEKIIIIIIIIIAISISL